MRDPLPARPVQRHHELAVQPFPKRMRNDQTLQFGNHRVVLAQREIGVDAVINCDQPKFVERAVSVLAKSG